MALWDDVPFGSLTSTSLVGVGLLLAAPVLLPLVGSVARPLVRTVLYTGFVAYDALLTTAATMGEQLSDLVAEATSEARSGEPIAPVQNDVAPHIIRPEGASA